ncbi:MAG TPA: serine hydrolase [Pyrinomonadaceae bacterium]|jgi:CubicO group peptidase (beta-lactamase class C family)
MQTFFRAAIVTTLFLSFQNMNVAQNKPQKKNQIPVSSKMNAKKEQSPTQLEKLIPKLMKDGDVLGLSVAIVKNGEVSWHRGFGVKNVETKEPVTDDTVFEAASLSKTVFAYAVLKMVEDGKLDLDVPLSKYLPAPYIESDERLNQITARRVLNHTTGFPNWRPNGKPLQIYFTPGERFSYSGEGFVYLQKVVEHLSGLPLDDLMKKTVFEPLGMMNSSYVWQQKYDSMKAYAHNSAGNLAGRGKPSEANAAASLHTTVFDYAKFVAAILQRKGIKETTVREMLRPQARVNEACAVCFDRADSGKLSDSISWGLGWGLENTANGDSFWHWGDNGNVKAYVTTLDKSKIGVVIFSNSANGLSIADEIVKNAIGVQQKSLAWLDYEPYNSPTKVLLRDIFARGEKAVDEYSARTKNNADGKSLNESQMNWIGYQLLGRKKYAEAIKVFETNVADFPKSPNVYDSLAEAYLKAGNTEAASKNYEKAVELNPQNTNAASILKRLQNQVKVESNILDSYAGKYEAPFGVLTVVRDKERLIGQVSGEPDTILLPQTKTQFVEAIRGTQLTFVKDEKGLVAHIVILLNGHEIQAKRIE